MSTLYKRSVQAFTPTSDKKIRKTVPHRIRFNGQFVELHSGKSLWRAIGHAKAALRNHVESCTSYTNTSEDVDAAIAELIRNGLEFVPMEEAGR